MKILNPFIGLILVAGIVFAGYYSTIHPKFIVWFGLITALISPVAFEFIIYPWRSKDKEVLKSLSKVSKIEKLIEEANDNETKVEFLKNQRIGLERVIAYEAERRILTAEQNIYISQGRNTLKELEKVNERLNILINEKQSLPDELKLLQSKIETIRVDDISFNLFGKKFSLRRDLFKSLPIYGPITFDLFKAIITLKKDLEKRN